MPDDHAIIFDLSKKVTMETKISDLGEKTRMDRDKLAEWKTGYNSTTVHQSRNTSIIGGRNTSKSNTSATDTKVDVKTRRVFDKITKRYVIKQGDTVLSDDESVTIDVDTGQIKKEDKSTSITVVNERKLNNNTDDKKEESSTSVDIKDHTDYKNKKEDDDDNVIDLSPEDVQVVEDTPGIVEVMMTSFPKEAVQAADKSYRAMPDEKKGYGEMDDLLSDIEIGSKKVAEDLGLLVVSNRVAQARWKQGFMAGFTMAMGGDPSAKAKNREKHIVGLKSLVLLLARFYKDTHTAYKDDVKHLLATAALEEDKGLDIDKLSKLFNQYEAKSIKDVVEILKDAEQYVSDKSSDKED
jgi:hypothetical protein